MYSDEITAPVDISMSLLMKDEEGRAVDLPTFHIKIDKKQLDVTDKTYQLFQ